MDGGELYKWDFVPYLFGNSFHSDEYCDFCVMALAETCTVCLKRGWWMVMTPPWVVGL